VAEHLCVFTIFILFCDIIEEINPEKENEKMINMEKIELRKKGDAINLSKDTKRSFGEIVVNLNWNQGSNQSSGLFAKLFGNSSTVDLDLGCLYELKNGTKGCVQALGNAFGSLSESPYIQLDHDDRTGSSTGGENLRINGTRISEIKRILVYSYIYEGAANWSEVDGIVTLTYPNGPAIEVKMNEHKNGKNMCAIALIENGNDETVNVQRVVEYFAGHQPMDQAFNWGMSWKKARK